MFKSGKRIIKQFTVKNEMKSEINDGVSIFTIEFNFSIVLYVNNIN